MDNTIANLDHSVPGFDGLYMQVLNFLHYEVDTAALKRELVAYADVVGMTDIAEQIPAAQISAEGKIAYCMNRGARLRPSSIDKVRRTLEDWKVRSLGEVDFDWDAIATSSQGKKVQHYVDCYSQIDNAKAKVLSGKISTRELAALVRKIVAARDGGKPWVTKQLLEHYRTALQEAKQDAAVAHWVKPLSTIADTLGLLVNNRAGIKTSAKNARVRKLTNTLEQSDRNGEKAAAKVTYKDQDTALGINSVDPTNLVGAAAAVIYNTKTRHCEVYFAEPGKRLSVQGSRITNYDNAKSLGKILRNPDTDLPHWNRAANIRRLEVLLANTNGKNWALLGKFNRNTMVLKVL
jgi:hypothetical protein